MVCRHLAQQSARIETFVHQLARHSHQELRSFGLRSAEHEHRRTREMVAEPIARFPQRAQVGDRDLCRQDVNTVNRDPPPAAGFPACFGRIDGWPPPVGGAFP